MEPMEITIQNLTRTESESATELIRQTFDRFVGKEYSVEGRETFNRFVAPESIKKRIENGNPILCAKIRGKLVGLLEIRDENHIALFFVDEQYHKRGIGKKLFDYALNEINNMYPGHKEITVNSSIFAEKIYKKMGFEKTAELQEKDGIKFIPMRYTIKK